MHVGRLNSEILRPLSDASPVPDAVEQEKSFSTGATVEELSRLFLILGSFILHNAGNLGCACAREPVATYKAIEATLWSRFSFSYSEIVQDPAVVSVLARKHSASTLSRGNRRPRGKEAKKVMFRIE